MADQTTPRQPDSGANESDSLSEPRGPLPADTPARFGRYETWRVLGSGAFGRVFLARDSEMGRFVAIKAPKDALAPDAHKVFLREARMLADIHHPNICPIHDVGTQDDAPYIVMRYVSGGTLNELLAREAPTPAQALRFAEQIANGLEEAHSHGIFHRDLKPANVLYDEKAGKLLLTDFGIARWADATHTIGGTPGTPAYMAPEQWGPGGPFGPITARTDVYALGVILFHMLTGTRLFTGSVFELMAHHSKSTPRHPSDVRGELDPRIDGLCLKALGKQQSDRYGSAKEFASAIAAYLSPPPPPADPDALPFAEPQPEPHESEPLFITGVVPELPAPAPRAKKREDDFAGCNPKANSPGARLHRGTAPLPPTPADESSRGDWTESTALKPPRAARVARLVVGGSMALLGLCLAAVFLFLLPSKQPEPSAAPDRAEKPKSEPKNDSKGTPAPKPVLPTLKPGETRDIEIAPKVVMKFCWIPPGKATLGASDSESERSGRDHAYTSRGFWMGKYEVTQAEWQAVMGSNPSEFDGKKVNKAQGMDTSRFPVENVSWEMISGRSGTGGFLAKVNAHNGIEAALGRPGKFKLPSEDEWEYAARGGWDDKRPFYWGWELNGTQANVYGETPYGTPMRGPYLGRTCAVDDTNDGKYAMHPWGLMHTHGNVWEWCDDFYSRVENTRITRGGSWSYFPRTSRAIFQLIVKCDSGDNLGFRLVTRLD